MLETSSVGEKCRVITVIAKRTFVIEQEERKKRKKKEERKEKTKEKKLGDSLLSFFPLRTDRSTDIDV